MISCSTSQVKIIGEKKIFVLCAIRDHGLASKGTAVIQIQKTTNGVIMILLLGWDDYFNPEIWANYEINASNCACVCYDLLLQYY